MNFSKNKPVSAKQPVIRKTVVAVPIPQIARPIAANHNGPVRPYDSNRFQLTQRKGATPVSTPASAKKPPKPAQRALAASRGVKRKSATPQPQFSSDDEDDEDDNRSSSDILGSDSDVSRKRIKSSASSVEPSGPRREIVCADAFEKDVKPLKLIDGAAATSGSEEAKFKIPWEEQAVTHVDLQYPSLYPRERFALKWPKNEAEDYKPMEDIIETIKTVCTFYLPPSAARTNALSDETGFARRFNRAWQRQSIPDFVSIVNDYNTLITTNLTTSTIPTHLRQKGFGDPLSLDWTRRILDQIYARTVSPAVESLKVYQNGTDYVYGELLPRFISEIFARTNLTHDQIFVDLGSGVGNVVLQAALEIGADAWGVEKMDNPAKLARRQAEEFPARVKLWGLSVGKVKLLQGDFTQEPEILEVLKKADVILVNNQAFTPALNDKLRDMFLDLKDGCQVASLKPFVPEGHKLTMRNYASVVNQFVQRKFEYFSNSVSWTDEGGKYYIAKVDRKPWHSFMRKNGLQ